MLKTFGGGERKDENFKQEDLTGPDFPPWREPNTCASPTHPNFSFLLYGD
jgi:hypothetical protein